MAQERTRYKIKVYKILTWHRLKKRLKKKGKGNFGISCMRIVLVMDVNGWAHNGQV